MKDLTKNTQLFNGRGRNCIQSYTSPKSTCSIIKIAWCQEDVSQFILCILTFKNTFYNLLDTTYMVMPQNVALGNHISI